MIACLKWVYKKYIQVVRQKGINVTHPIIEYASIAAKSRIEVIVEELICDIRRSIL